MLGLRAGFDAVRRLVLLAAARFGEDRCLQVAGNLTFTTLLALVPMFTIAFTMFAAFPVFEDWANAFKIFLLTTLVPEVGGRIITVYMQQFADNAAKLTAVGLFFLAVTAVLLLVDIERVFNGIWRARRARSAMQRVIIYWTAITVGPLLVGASLSLTSWLLAQSVPSTGTTGMLAQISLRSVPAILNGAAFGLLYLMVPNRRVRVRDAFVGGVAVALMFEAMKRGFAIYLQAFPTYDLIYGTFSTVPIFLLWLYLSWCLVLLGAVVVAVLPEWRVGAERASALGDATLFRVLALIEALEAARSRSAAPSPAELARSTGVLDDVAESLLERMALRGWVRRVDSGGWVLAAALDVLTLAEIYRLFVFDATEAGVPSSRLAGTARQALIRMQADLDVSLSHLMAVPPVTAADGCGSEPSAGRGPGQRTSG